MRTSEPLRFDIAVRDVIHGWATPGLTSAMRTITSFGSAWYLLPVAAAISLCLTMDGSRRQAMLFGITVLGSYFLDNGLKLVVHRLRPEPFFGYAKPTTYSFPSGHALLSLSFYLILASVLISPEWAGWKKITIRAAAILMILCVGVSRVYLGVHYPTDVLGGYAAAIAWIAAARATLRRRGGPQTDVPRAQQSQ